jgi:parallel beta-helix repeat protein
VADNDDGLRILDVSTPSAPVEVGFYNTPGFATNVAVLGNYAYVADGSSGLRIIDISTPASPSETGFYNTDGYTWSVFVDNNIAYVADGDHGLRFLDVSTPSAPVETGFFNPGSYSVNVTVVGQYAYLAAEAAGLRIIDISTPGTPLEVGFFNEYSDVTDVCVQGDYAYIADHFNGFYMVDISTPSAPVEVGFYNTARSAESVFVLDDKIYVTNIYAGLFILQYHQAQTIHVPGDYETITEAMAEADSGDIILVAPGTYVENFEMKPGVVLQSEEGPEETIIAKSGKTQLITTAPDAVIQGFTIADNDNGQSQAGNGIYSSGDNCTICYCIVRNNRIGIYLDESSTAVVYNNTIDNNSTSGLYMQISPAPEIYNNIITNNGKGIYRNTAHSMGNPIIRYNNYHGNGEDYAYYGTAWTPNPGTGELFNDPLYAGGTPFDYHLTESSPCIDTGDPASPLDPDGTRCDMGALPFDQTTSIEDNHDSPQPSELYLYQAYPNPFNPRTTIQYYLPLSAKVKLIIYDIMGKEIRRLYEGVMPSGLHRIVWDGQNSQNFSVPSGMYFYQIAVQATDSEESLYSQTRKMVLMK